MCAALACLTACSRYTKLSDLQLPGQQIAEGEVAGLVAQLSLRSEEIQTFRGLARCTLEHGDDQFAFRYLFIFEKPSRIRIEQLPTTGFYTLSLLTADDGMLTFFDTATREALQTHDSQRFFEETLRLPVGEADVIASLVGRFPGATSELSLLTASLSSTENAIYLKTESHYAVVDRTGTVSEIRWFDRESQEEQFSVRYEEYQERDGISLPTETAISFVRDEAMLRCRYEQVRVNQPLKPGVFRATVPDGYSFR